MRRGLTVVAAAMAMLVWTAGSAGASTGWAIQATPNPSGSAGTYLAGVSCPSAASCTAAGFYVDSSGIQQTVAENWNGSTWAIQAAPSPSGSVGADLYGISCASMTNCAAAGQSVNSSGATVTLAESWTGGTWAIEATPSPSGATASGLDGVSCVSATSCTAVGLYVDSSGIQQTLAESWNGGTWAIEATPNPSGASDSILNGVSCASATSCTAVGSYVNSSGATVTLAESWNGRTWAIEATPTPSGAINAALNGVSCSSTASCTAVGYYVNSSGTTGLAESWNGRTWAVQATPSLSGSGFRELASVSCASAAACTAAGFASRSGNTVTLAENWNGRIWAVQATPNPSGSTASGLSGVSCASTTSCTAVGTAGTPTQALAEHH
jgi:hypothetical protein